MTLKKYVDDDDVNNDVSFIYECILSFLKDSGAKKASPFENLSRDDLIKKCRGLLGIAQKAKQAKDGEC